jgi:hypothetical protein
LQLFVSENTLAYFERKKVLANGRTHVHEK